MSETPTPSSRGRARSRALRLSTCCATWRPTTSPAPGSAAGPRPLDIVHGTTVLAIRYDGGVVMAGDRRATAGYTIASRRIEKVFPADDFSGVAIAGAAGPAVELVRLFQVQLEHYEKIEGEPLSLEGKANQLGQLVRTNLPAAMQGFVVVPLFAGYDATARRGRVFSYDVTGGKYEEADFQTNGSGGIHARNWIKATWQEDMTRDDAVDLALRALFAAADEDSATGGPDLIRGIYPIVAVISSAGFDALRRRRHRKRAQALVGGREEGAGYEHAVLRAARAADERPRRLRAEGHRPRRSLVAFSATDGIVHRRGEPVPHAAQDLRDLRPHRVRRRGQVQRVRDAAGRGIRQADLKGYSFAREDVNARSLANAYGQTLGQVFTHEMKPYEVEILLAQVGDTQADDELYHILYDGTVMDEEGGTVLGGQAEQIAEAMEARYEHGMGAAAAIRLGAWSLGGPDDTAHAASSRSRCSTAPARAARSAGSKAPSSGPSSPDSGTASPEQLTAARRHRVAQE